MSVLRREVNRILTKIKNGDEKSKNELFLKTYNHLKIVAYPFVQNKNDVEDILTEAYDRIFRYIDNFDPKKDGYNWMCKILQNTAYDWNKRYPNHISLEEISESEEAYVNMEEKLELKDEVHALFKDYSRRDERMMLLRFGNDYSFKEIATILNMSVSNVHKRTSILREEILQKDKNKVEK